MSTPVDVIRILDTATRSVSPSRHAPFFGAQQTVASFLRGNIPDAPFDAGGTPRRSQLEAALRTLREAAHDSRSLVNGAEVLRAVVALQGVLSASRELSEAMIALREMPPRSEAAARAGERMARARNAFVEALHCCEANA